MYLIIIIIVIINRGGATVLEVGGGQFCERSKQKKILIPHFLASRGTKYCLDS